MDAHQIPNIAFVDNLTRMSRRKLTVFASNYGCYIILFFLLYSRVLETINLLFYSFPEVHMSGQVFSLPKN